MNRMVRLTAAFGAVFAMVLGAPTPAKADPITAAIVTAVGLTGTAAAVATFVVNGLFTTAFSWAAGKLLGKSKASVQERQASVTTLSLGEVPREALIGEAVTGGSLIDAFNHGGQYGTDYVTRCIALVDHAVEDLVGYYIDDQYYAFSANGVQSGFSGALDIEFVNATEAGAAPPARFLTASVGSWISTDVLAGITHVWFSYKCDEAVWPQGHPQVRFLLRGLKAYDPRKDAALGYEGEDAQTWSDPSTHAFTRNAALLRYAFARGIYAEGRQGEPEHLLIGRGLSAEEAPPEPVIAAANLCDEDVDGKARYTANGVIRASDDFIFVEEMFAAAMAGVIVQREGGVEIEPGQAKAAVVTITDADLVAGEPVSFSEFLSDGDGGRISTVIPRYIEPAQTWKDHSGPVRRDLADIAADGGPREVTLPLMLVTEGAQADRCAEITRLLGRLEKRGTIVLPPEYGRLEEGDWIAWTSARRFGGETVRFRIESWTLDEKWRMRLSLREIAAAAYGEPDPVADESDPPADPVELDPLELQDVTAEVVALDGAGSGVPAVRFTWSTADPAVIAIRAEVRRVGETVAAPTRSDEIADLEMTVTNGVGPDQAIEVRLVPITRRSRPVIASDWIPLTTGSLTAGDVTPNSPAMLEMFYRQVDEVLASTLRIVDEQGRRASDTTDAQRFIDRIAVVNPATGRADLRSESVFANRLSLAAIDARVAEGIEGDGRIRQPVPRDVSVLSGIYNEQIEITAEGELVINNVDGPVTGGQVLRVQEATGFLGHDAFIRRSPIDSDQGGRQFFQKPLTNTTLTGDLAFDVYQSTMRWFDATTLYGVTLPFSAFQPSIGGRIVVSTAAGIVAGDLGSTTALRAPYARIGNGATGFLTLNEGDATHPGYMALHTTDLTRRGYVGFSNGTDTLIISGENGYHWAFDQVVDFFGGANFSGTVTGISKAMVGLGNVDNTSDANKPVSTAQQTALDLKANLAGAAFTGAVSITGAGLRVNTTGGAGTSSGRHINLGSVSSPTDWRAYDGSTTAAIQMENSSTEGFVLVATQGASVPRTQLITTGGFQLSVGATIGGAGTNAIQVLPDGKVGFGTGTPTEALHIERSASNPAIQLKRTGGSNNPDYKIVSDESLGGLVFGRTGVANDVIFKNGNSGFGTTGPTERLHVEGRVMVTGSGYTANPVGGMLGFYSGAVPQTYIQAPSGGEVVIWDGPTNQLAVFRSDGKFGVGVASPTESIHTNGAIRLSGSLIRTGADQTFAVDTGQGFHWSVNGSDVALLEANGRLSINLLSIGGANFDPASKVGMTGSETVAGVKTFSSIPVAGGLTTTGGDMNFRVDTGQGYRWKVNGTDVALLEASGRLSLNAITMGGLGLGEWTDWTPTPTAETGTATGLASVYAEVERHGKSVTVNFAVSQTAIGTGAAAILVPLPYAAKASRNFFGNGKNLNSGADLRVEAVGSNLRITAANSYPFGSGAESLAGSVTYQCA